MAYLAGLIDLCSMLNASIVGTNKELHLGDSGLSKWVKVALTAG